MGKNTNISLGHYFEEFIDNEVKSGRYSSESEVIRCALRLLEKTKMLDDLEELEDIKLYDAAKEDEPEYIDADQAFKEIEKKRRQD